MFLKLIINRIKVKKRSNILIMLVLMLSNMVILADLSIGDTAIKYRAEQLKNLSMDTQIMLAPSETELMAKTDKICEILDDCREVSWYVPRYSFYGSFNNDEEKVLLYVTDIEEHSKKYSYPLEQGRLEDIRGNRFIIGPQFAEKNKLGLNDPIIIYINGMAVEGIVGAIGEKNGLFDDVQVSIAVDYSFTNDVLDIGKPVNRIDICVKQLGKIDNTILTLREKLFDYPVSVRAKFDSHFYDSYMETIELALTLFAGLMMILNVFIVFSVIRSQNIENLDEMITLRSIGMSRKMYMLIFGAYTFTMALFAGFIGTLLAIPMTYGVVYISLGNSCVPDINFVSALIVIAVISLTTVLSTLAAVLKISGVSLVALMKKNYGAINTGIKKQIIFKGLFVVLGIVMAFLVSRKTTIYCYAISAAIMLVSLICLGGLLFAGLSKVAELIFSGAQKLLWLAID